ncbi:hypothetical protein CHELA40_13699 [Chelatococcus asaccharovorans]|nr:hypothetical protein CHELA40_13699 [Chelatococcus asaccharovorans]CAH1676240.1 hypothetical protein CHELA17_61926 [Chelatococcus asaccharovorans]
MPRAVRSGARLRRLWPSVLGLPGPDHSVTRSSAMVSMRFHCSPSKSNERAGPSAYGAAPDPVGMDYGSTAHAPRGMPLGTPSTIRGPRAVRSRAITALCHATPH